MYRTLLSTTAAVLISAAATSARVAGHTDSSTALVNEARETLHEIEATCAKVATEAQREELMSRDNRLDWRMHADSLTQIKDNLNSIGKQVQKLESEQTSLAPWEREALVKAVPMLKDAADNTSQAIEFVNANMTHVWLSGTLHGYTERVAKDSEQAKAVLHNFLKLDRANRDAKEARDRLWPHSGS